MLPKVGNGRKLIPAPADQDIAAQDNHADNGRCLDQGEPEFKFAENFDVSKIDGIDQEKEKEHSLPFWDVRVPEVYVFACRRQLRHAGFADRAAVSRRRRRACRARL